MMCLVVKENNFLFELFVSMQNLKIYSFVDNKVFFKMHISRL